MKNTLFLIVLLSLFACAEKTAENSAYFDEIAQLDETYNTVDSNHNTFTNIDIDTMQYFRTIVTQKYKKAKEVYTTEFLDTNYEKIMLIARGQFTKKLSKIAENSEKIKKEYKYSTNQYKTLRENLIHENGEEEKLLTYYNEEKQALIILNAEIVNFNEDLSNTISLAGVIIPQLDSIIEVHEEPQ